MREFCLHPMKTTIINTFWERENKLGRVLDMYEIEVRV